MIGQSFGKLTVVSANGKDKHGKPLWNCVCVCGKDTVAVGAELRSGHKKSCGCARDGNPRHGMTGTPEHNAWKSIMARCTNPNSKDYPYYGGRGILVMFSCFEDFYAEIGPRPNGSMSVDRIDSNGHYAIGNIRWATRKTQGNNTRRNRNITAYGKTQSISVWAEQFGMSKDALRRRLNDGWHIEDALTIPIAPWTERRVAAYKKRKDGR